LLQFGDQRLDALDQLGLRRSNASGNRLERRNLSIDPRFGFGTGQRLDASHASSDAAFRNDAEQPNLAAPPDVGAAAQFTRAHRKACQFAFSQRSR